MAMYGSNRQSNQRDTSKDINTKGIQMMNSDGFEPSTLSIGSWNDMLSLRINPALEPSKRTEGRTFDYDRNVSTSLNVENVMILLYKLKTKILPAMENGEEASVALSLNGGASLVAISTGKKLTNEIRPFLAIHKNLNEQTRKPEMSMYYEFKRARAIENYDEKTGDYVMSEEIYSELQVFIKMLEAYLDHVGKFSAHFQRYANRFQNDKLNHMVGAIADKVGANTSYYDGNTSRYGHKRNLFDTSGSSNAQHYSNDAEQETLNDITELTNMLDQ